MSLKQGEKCFHEQLTFNSFIIVRYIKVIIASIWVSNDVYLKNFNKIICPSGIKN